MRPIKFKLYCTKNKKMGYSVELFEMLKLSKYVPDFDGLIALQFTGLSDCDGNDIYEGDILQTIPYYFEKPELIIVEFTKFEKCVGCAYQTWGMGFYVSEYDDDNFRIIGNIYETPELLETK